MTKTYKSLLWGLAALVCIVMLSFNTEAAEFRMGPGDHYDAKGNIVSLDGTVLVKADGTIVNNPNKSSYINASSSTIYSPAAEKAAASKPAAPSANTSYSVKEVDGVKVYTFEGKQYIRDASYGTHKLTGYCEEECGTAKTYSGNIAKANHTVSAPSDLPIGTVIILEGAEGPNASQYNGVYVVEDRGGEKLENEGIIDIFFNSMSEAEYVTRSGWNYMNVWIAKQKG